MIKAIAASDFKHGIGKNGTLPWPKNKEDFKQFKEKTTGHIIVMGSKTWDDPLFPSPLKNRDNYVISSKTGFVGANGIINNNIIESIQELDAKSEKDVWIIGGANIFSQCLDIIEEFHLTKIVGNFDCDVFINFKYVNWEMELKNKVNDSYYFMYRRKIENIFKRSRIYP